MGRSDSSFLVRRTESSLGCPLPHRRIPQVELLVLLGMAGVLCMLASRALSEHPRGKRRLFVAGLVLILLAIPLQELARYLERRFN